MLLAAAADNAARMREKSAGTFEKMLTGAAGNRVRQPPSNPIAS